MIEENKDRAQSVDLTNRRSESKGMVYMLTFLSCMGGFLFGYDTGIISGALVLISDKFDLEEWEKELIVSLTVVGALLAACFSGILIDKYGRRVTILSSSLLFGLGALLMAIAPDLEFLMIGRFLVGLGVGSGSMAVPVYMSEVSDASVRGSLLTCINVAITFGQFISCIIAGAFSYVTDGWRFMLGLALLPALVQFIGFLYMPESPRWLIERGRQEEAKKVLLRLGGTPETAQNEFERLVEARSCYPSNGSDGIGGYGIFFENTSSRRALGLGCSLQAAQQFGGINTIM